MASLFLPRGGNFRLTKQTNKQNTMKNKLLALLASIGLVSSASAIEINENLSINGFIDGSYFDGDTAAGDKSFNLDEIEVNMKQMLEMLAVCWNRR